MKAIWYTFLFLSVTSISFAQYSTSFQHVTTNEGLSQGNVTSIIQDDEGFLWFGTQDGLNKYDGKTIKVYKNDPLNPQSLSHNYIYSLLKDRDGNIWIGSGEGLIFFDREKELFTSFNRNENYNSILEQFRVLGLAEDANGNLWVGTYGGGVNFFDVKSKKFTNFKHDPDNASSVSSNFISTIHIDRDGNVCVGTASSGLNLYNPDSKSFTRFQHDPNNASSISGNDVTKILDDNEGNLWIGVKSRGLNCFNIQSKSFTRYRHNGNEPESLGHDDVLSLTQGGDGNIWVGTQNGGISILQHGTKSFITFKQEEGNNQSLNNNSIYSLFTDKHENIWIGTYIGGINFVSRLPEKFKHYTNDKFNINTISHNNVLSVMEDHEANLWIGTDGGGLNMLNKNTKQFTRHRHNSNNPKSIRSDVILSIYEDRDHDLWIGNFKGGLDLFKRDENRFINFRLDSVGPGPNIETIGRILQDRKGYIWVGTYGTGISRYDKKSNTFKHFHSNPEIPGSISHALVLSLYEDRKGKIWAGTAGEGLNVFQEETKTFKCYKHDKKDSTSISNNLINVITEDSQGNLWIGTNGGLNIFHPENESFTSYHQSDGLPNDVIYGIQEDDNGNLWLSTTKGLSKFNLKNKTFRNFDVSDGLQGNSFNRMSFYKDKAGNIFFGGLNGVNYFHPDSIVNNPVIPDVYITNFEIFNKSVNVYQKDSPIKKSIDKTSEIVLSYKESFFAFDFAALNYTSPDKNQYAYKMDGFDKDWIFTHTNKASYTNLNPGHYTFKVKASNNDGVWNEEGTSIRIIITPPFWKTWTFRIISLLTIVAAIYSFFRIRVSVIHKQKLLLQKEVMKQTAELIHQKEALEVEREEAEKARQEAEQANQAKSIFLATMSHEIRTPMNGVLGMASLLSETTQTKEQQEYTDTIRNSGQALLTIINDILDFSKIDSGNMELDNHGFDLRQCVEEVMDVFSPKASEIGLDLLYEIDHNLPTQIIGDKHRLRQILINLISNAIKFTPKGEIFVGVDLVKIEGKHLEIGFHVRDTGVGIPDDKLSRLFKSFSQVDSATNRKYGGTGLGLVISQRLVQLMGGMIIVESEHNVGTTFKFTIHTQVDLENPEPVVPYNLLGNEGKKVLLVDENTTNLNVLKNQLEQWKLSPTLALSGKEALDILDRQNNFDIAIVDMQMPGMDGLELAKFIKLKLPALPIILISSIGDESKKKYPELFSAVICKPVKQHQLSQEIRASLKVEKAPIPADDGTQNYVLSVDFAEKFPLSIMLAEDNPVNQKLAVRILNKLGYQHIEVAQNGLVALEKLTEKFYEVILMDMQMPEMDGLEATKMIRLMDRRQPIIIAMTANAMQGDRDLCLQVGMNEYITKPIKLEALMSALEKASESFRLVAGHTQYQP